MGNRKEIEELGLRILGASRVELFLSMRFMGSALDSLSYCMDLSTRTIGTDAYTIRFNPEHLLKLYIEAPHLLNRLYIHMLLHCLFRHMFTCEAFENSELYDLSSDIMVEAVLDSMDYPAIARTDSDFRDRWYKKLRDGAGKLTAELIYKYLEKDPPDFREYLRLRDEFTKDDHGFWYRMEKDPDNSRKPDTDSRMKQPPKELDDKWKDQAKRVKAEMETLGKEASEEQGSLLRMLRLELRRKRSYRDFLRRYSSLHEETRIDMDSFDYGYYQYGMSLYGNMPLIEENEYRLSRKIKTLVIAIDTSASCQAVLVKRFLNETAQLLSDQESFFRSSEILIIECDDRIQEEIYLKSPDELKRYAEGFIVKGGFGTDFRPVFRRVEELRRKGILRGLKGMMYFTDGFGTYPEKPPGWETAFVLFSDEDPETEKIPVWAYTLYLDGEN